MQLIAVVCGGVDEIDSVVGLHMLDVSYVVLIQVAGGVVVLDDTVVIILRRQKRGDTDTVREDRNRHVGRSEVRVRFRFTHPDTPVTHPPIIVQVRVCKHLIHCMQLARH